MYFDRFDPLLTYFLTFSVVFLSWPRIGRGVSEEYEIIALFEGTEWEIGALNLRQMARLKLGNSPSAIYAPPRFINDSHKLNLTEASESTPPSLIIIIRWFLFSLPWDTNK